MDSLAGSGGRPAFVIRELVAADEIEAYFRLRYDVYSQSGYLPERRDRIEIDAHDPGSRFLGAFEGATRQLVAGVRMILPAGEPNGRAVRELAARLKEEPLPAERPALFPTRAAFDADWFFAFCENRGLRLTEFGRTVCRPDHRKSGIGTMLVHAVHALAILYDLDAGFSSCPPKLAGFYGKLGCQVMGSLGTSQIRGIDTELVALLSDLKTIGLDGRVERAARDLARGGVALVPSAGGLDFAGSA